MTKLVKELTQKILDDIKYYDLQNIKTEETLLLVKAIERLQVALREMIGTHGEPCVHFPCESLTRANSALLK